MTSSSIFAATEISSTERLFFEQQVEPLLKRACYECHSHQGKIKGGLTLDSAGGWKSGGDSGTVIVPGKPLESLLYQAVAYTNADYEMPPKGKLADTDVVIISRWIEMGAPDPRGGGIKKREQMDVDKDRAFWAFRPLPTTPSEVPVVKDQAWPRGTIDRFILARLEAAGIAPAPDAEAVRFQRRLSYDITGLPATTEQPLSVEQLLATKSYGEKWGRHWLDQARYADSNGSSHNVPFPVAWRYRNWVIAAFNDDLPYDQFITKQLAGDLLPYTTPEERDNHFIATGFLMLGSKVLGEFDKAQLTMDVVDEQIDTIGKSMLGLTLGCARCHDHKFDPVSHRDYYAIAGIFTSTVTITDRYGGAKEDESDWSRRGLGVGGDDKLRSFLKEHRYDWVKSSEKKYSTERELRKLKRQPNTTDDQLAKATKDADIALKKYIELEAQIPPYAMAVADAETPADTATRIRGVPSSLGPVVPRGFLQVASWPDQPTVTTENSGRLALAQWIASPKNPLTARVWVNRVWQHLFGEGLVRSVDNVGLSGEKPSHPALLDYLALRLIFYHWQLKPLIQEIVSSRTYRLSTRHDTHASLIDPENRLLWRQNRRRLEPEEIRDTLLLVSGQLDRSAITTICQLMPSKSLDDMDADIWEKIDAHRTVYQPIIRTMEADVMQLFDGAPSSMTTGQRAQTTVAPQALYFLNAPFVYACAKRMAYHITDKQDRDDINLIIQRAFHLAVGRAPTNIELQQLSIYLATQYEGASSSSPHDVTKLCQLILSSTQFQLLD